jgi:hypothetical protein
MSNLVPLPEELDQQICRDTNMKIMHYTKHEFIKTNEVKYMINEAFQSLVDKMKERDKVI